jgi:MFS family permease
MLAWWRRGTPDGRRAIVAAGLGWMLDAFDVTLFALALPAIRKELGLSTAAGGMLGSVALIAAAAGGVAFGWISDRYGRTRALMLSVILYSVFTAACGFAANFAQFVVFRVCLGLGMGGEWASGASLVSETWNAEDRGKALALMQSGWAIGYGLAAAVNYLVQPGFGWRAVFFVGILPAFLTIWVRRNVREPDIWQRSVRGGARPRISGLFARGLAPLTLALTAMNACTLFGWWSFNLWLPSYLQEPASRGGLGLQMLSSSTLIVVMQVGMWLGYVTFGYVSDRIGVPAVCLRVGPRADRAARARAFRRVLRDRLLQRVRRRDRRDLPNRDPRNRAGLHLQHRPRRVRRGAVHRRHAGTDSWVQRRALHLVVGVSRRGRVLDLDTGDAGPSTDIGCLKPT